MIVNTSDMREAARRRLPKIFFDYIDGGSFGEETLGWNRSDFAKWRLEQRVLTGKAGQDLSSDVLGARRSLPVMLGPVRYLGLYRGNGEILAARAAHAAGISFCLSTFSIRSIETLARSTSGDLHFQLYMMDDEGLNRDLIESAKRAGASALYLTVDTAITGIRERDVRNGFRAARRLTPSMLLSMARRPAWCCDVLRSGWPSVEAVEDRPDFGCGALEQAANLSRRIDKTVNWSHVGWLRERWPGRLVIKAILSAEDAPAAASAGADAIVISNHGGRQLDNASSTIAVLPEVAEAVRGDWKS